jgi:ParB-like chromosome segregation protein Spo0J
MMGEVNASIEVAPSELHESLSALRLCCGPETHQQLRLSLATFGQLTPVQVYRVESKLEIFDGLKRLRAARELSWPVLRATVHALDPPGAKVRLWRCNLATGLSEIEEAWLVRSLYRDDRMNQGQIAVLLGGVSRSWVCRRLALAEDLSDALTANVRLGLVSATACRELVQLPRGNQDAAAQVVMRRGLTTRQTARLCDALLLAPEVERAKLIEQAAAPILAKERKAKAARRTPSEQLLSDAFAMKRLSVRLQTRLLERSLSSHGLSACAAVSGELTLLHAALKSLQETLALRLHTDGATNVAA